MKLFKVIVLSLLLSSCQYNQSVKKDFNTDTYTRGKGLACNDVYMTINDVEDNRNEIIYGEKIKFIFDNITGFKVVEEKAYPAMSIYVVKNQKDTVLNIPNTIKDISVNGTDLKPLQLQAHITAGLPYSKNETYKVFVNIWDTKGNGTYNLQMPFTIKENDLLRVKTEGLEYSNVYLWDQSKEQVLTSKDNFKFGKEYLLFIEGLDGLSVKDSLVYPMFSLDIIDNDKEEILSSSNLFNVSETKGVSYNDIKEKFYVNFSFTEGYLSNPCKLKSVVKDLYSEKEIRILTEINIETQE
ncbi:hypothetical protein [Mesoflavibacter sp. SCSIO 43206]|uniref:hypothetical protein n=1 Tax=Mesoflavibacter sp. SCSIO 43206 TaxID=2779362 RepID=UPI001CA9B316|nr:hypothetical protein [Mesoflavibacter sp. SCSIO 43206]UAB75292.1 hypothetical protein INR78_13000 [Mesoflavibacter sp. SCSIO 43206]